MADALLSTPVALAGAGIAATLLGVAGAKIKKNADDINPALMGVMGAFVFAAQMVNFSIPGTGSSGHIVGGILLASVLGPWAAFITLSSAALRHWGAISSIWLPCQRLWLIRWYSGHCSVSRQNSGN